MSGHVPEPVGTVKRNHPINGFSNARMEPGRSKAKLAMTPTLKFSGAFGRAQAACLLHSCFK